MMHRHASIDRLLGLKRATAAANDSHRVNPRRVGPWMILTSSPSMHSRSTGCSRLTPTSRVSRGTAAGIDGVNRLRGVEQLGVSNRMPPFARGDLSRKGHQPVTRDAPWRTVRTARSRRSIRVDRCATSVTKYRQVRFTSIITVDTSMTTTRDAATAIVR